MTSKLFVPIVASVPPSVSTKNRFCAAMSVVLK